MTQLFLALLIIIAIPLTQCAGPSKFFWRPRLAIDLNPTKAKTKKGEQAVLVKAYRVGMTVLAIGSSFQSSRSQSHLDPLSAHYYTNIYRWTLRYLSLIPNWLGGVGPSYPDTHKVWQKRFYYMNEFLPNWIRVLIPHIKKEDWIEEERQYARFVKYAEHTFGKHYTGVDPADEDSVPPDSDDSEAGK